MRSRKPDRAASGFALVELVVAVALIAATLALAALLLPDARRRSRLASSTINLQQLGKGMVAFATDNADRVATFSWQPGTQPVPCGDGYILPPAADYNTAAANQAVCIIRRRGNRPDFTAISGWFPWHTYSHLVLSEYLNNRLPDPIVASPGDGPRLAWQRATIDAPPSDQGQAYFALACRPGYPSASSNDKRWPYSSSYELAPAFCSPDAAVNGPSGQILTLAQSTTHRTFIVGNAQTVLGNRTMSEVRHPSNKALMYEAVQRFFGSREAYFMYQEARVPVLLVDGSVSVRSINQANRGFQPNTPTSPSPTSLSYQPEPSWEPPCLNGASEEVVTGYIRWTRSGMRGRDFAGPEVPWVP